MTCEFIAEIPVWMCTLVCPAPAGWVCTAGSRLKPLDTDTGHSSRNSATAHRA